MHDHPITFVDRPGDLFDDADWGGVVETLWLMAQSAKEPGFKGLIFDDEEYAGNWVNFPEDYSAADPTDLPLFQAQASKRGREVMEAVAGVFPESAFGVMHGPCLSSVDGGTETPDAVLDQGGRPLFEELQGPFFTGLLEGKGAGQALIDWDVPQDLFESWEEEVVISHMVYTDQYPR